MRWFQIALYSVATMLFVGFVGWVITRMMQLGSANYWMGRLIIWDLYAIGGLMAYAAFVGAWHLWEKLTGRMEPAADDPRSEG